MILHPLIKEPELEFGDARSICPRQGIAEHGVYDIRLPIRRKEIFIGAVGTPEGLEKFQSWVERSSNYIEPKFNPKVKHLMPNFHYPFYGFNEDSGFRTKVTFGEFNARRINPQQIEEIISQADKTDRIKLAVDAYFDHAQYLNDHRSVDVIVCILPNSLVEAVYRQVKDDNKKPTDEEVEADLTQKAIRHAKEEAKDEIEQNFRRELKARTLISLDTPIQLVWERTLQEGDGGNNQPEATRAWNFFTALYYKTRESIPWKMVTNPNLPATCYVGISFYRSRDKKTLHTSLAQIFDERGQGVILRGAEVVTKDDDPRPYLTETQAHDLLSRALGKYRFAMENSPGRLVIHKSSNFRLGEIEGFKSAAKETQIDNVDFITILDSDLRLYRKGSYPPYRGTHVELTRENHLLYTRGSVEYYQTYPGQYIPQPLEVRVVKSSESPRLICEEVLTLTKMNWNNTQFDGKKPITLVCGHKVGEILKYLEDVDDDKLKINYCYYM